MAHVPMQDCADLLSAERLFEIFSGVHGLPSKTAGGEVRAAQVGRPHKPAMQHNPHATMGSGFVHEGLCGL